MKHLLGFIGLGLLFSGCTLSVTAAQPKPNIAIAPQTEKLALKLGGDVKDQYQIPSQQGIPLVNVTGWLSTLQSGFDSAFGGLFRGSGNDLVMEIDRADLVLTPVSVSADSGVTAVRAQVTYRARLIDGSGNVVAMSAATSESKGAAVKGSQAEMTTLAGDAVESMYELIAKDLFAAEPKS